MRSAFLCFSGLAGIVVLCMAGSAQAQQTIDVDNDGCADLVVNRIEGGQMYWYISPASNDLSRMPTHYPRVTLAGRKAVRIPWGLHGDKPVLGDVSGDGFPEMIVYRPQEGNWYIRWSNWDGHLVVFFPGTGIPHLADFDGDGIKDLSFINPGANSVDIRLSNGSYSSLSLVEQVKDAFNTYTTTYAGHYSPALPGDTGIISSGFRNTFDNYVRRLFSSRLGPVIQPNENVQSYIPIVGDYDGDGAVETGRFAGGVWSVFETTNHRLFELDWGLPLIDLPILGDFDGDGIYDPCVWRITDGTFYARLSTGFPLPGWTPHYGGFACQWGLSSDRVFGTVELNTP